MAERVHDAIGAVTQALQSAPLDTDGWDAALKELARRTRSSRTNLVEVSNGAFIYNWVTDIPPGFHEGLQEIGGGSPDVNWRVASTSTPLKVISERDYAEARKRMKTSIYDDYSEGVDSPFGCQTVLDQTPRSFHGLAVLRSRQDGETSEADRAVFAATAPKVLTAIRMQKAIENQGASLVAGALEAMTSAAFVCDAYGRVMALTGAAEQILSDRSGLRLHERRLSALRPRDDRRLQRALHSALHDVPQQSGAARIWLCGEDGPSSGRLCEVFALPRREWTFGFAARAMIVVRASRGLGDSHRQLLREVFSLTPAEAEVAAMAAEGLSRDQIATQRSASPNTVHTQLRSIFGKAGVSREAELVAIINRMLR